MMRLTRSVVVSSFDVAATVAVGRDRPEFLAVARLAADLDRPISARDVLRELLGPRPEVLGWRVIERCVGLGLLERSSQSGDARLSGAGRLALEHGEVLVPEEGVWRFFMIDDPLVPGALIHAQRLETEPVRKERESAKARTPGERQPQADHPSELLRRCKGGAPNESLQNGHLFQLCELAERGAAGPGGKLRLDFSWSAEPSIQLSGSLPLGDDRAKANPIDAGVPLPEVVARLKREGLWQALVTHATQVPGPVLERWRATTGEHVVPLALSSLPAAARHRFRQDLDVPASDLMGLGRFEPTVLQEVHLVPASDTDAQAWLAWLQWQAVNDYVTPALLEQQGAELRARFPHHRPRALSASELLARARADRDERSWFLLGPADLGLWS